MKKIIYLLIIVSWSTSMVAKIKLPPLLSDNMVLQQQTNVRIWGEASPNSSITIVPSWADHEIKTHTDAKGCWELWMKTPVASYDEQTLTLTDKEHSITLHHILIGEVWLCAGQSNMVMPLNGFGYCPIRDSNNVIADAPNYPGIRMATIKPTVQLSPQEYAEGSWKQPSAENASMFSAAAYHYALALQRTLQVPVGIITCAWGGSRVEGWLPKEILQTYPDEDPASIGSTQKPVYLQSMLMYNGLLYPCHNYTIKGFIWYQGESNVKSSDTYAERLATMIEHWRDLWKLGDLPFYYVEIAPFACEYNKKGIIGALLREAQQKALSLIPNSGMIGTNDLVEEYEASQVHPCNKKGVGERLAHMSLNRTYKYQAIESDYPAYKSMKINGNTIEISLYHAEKGLSPWIGITGFEIAGPDKIFYPAEASLNQNEHTVVIKSTTVNNPVAVRYCFQNFQKGNLTNTRNLPVRPFRTDQWQ